MLVVEGKKKRRQKEDIWSDNQKSSRSYLMVWNSDNAVTFKNGEEREKKHFLKGRISVESFLWKGMETHWDIYISTEIFLTQHAAKEQFCIHGQGTHTAWSKPNRSQANPEWEHWEQFGFRLPPSWDPSHTTTHARKRAQAPGYECLIPI